MTSSEELLKKRLVDFWNSQQIYWDPISTSEAADSPQRKKAASFLPAGGRVLDVACGSGANTASVSPHCRYFGSDISLTGLRRAQASSLPFVCADADQLPFQSGAFDGAISTFALEHSVNPKRMLEELRRVVRPGGRIVLLGPSWDLPFWYPNALRSALQKPVSRLTYAANRTLGQLRGWIFGTLPFERVNEPDAFHHEFVYDSDAVYVVWSYEVIEEMRRGGCRLVHGEVDDRLLGTRKAVQLLKQVLLLFPIYRLAGSTVLLVFER
jgi:SAM-dependent methyltransferase